MADTQLAPNAERSPWGGIVLLVVIGCAVGVLYNNPAETTYEDAVHQQNEVATSSAKITSIEELLNSGATWTV